MSLPMAKLLMVYITKKSPTFFGKGWRMMLHLSNAPLKQNVQGTQNVKILVDQVVGKLWIKSQNIVFVNNSRTAWPTKVLMLFLVVDAYSIFQGDDNFEIFGFSAVSNSWYQYCTNM